MLTVKLPNGLTLTGTSEQVLDTARKLGYTNIGADGIHYVSESKGIVRIADMDTRHVRNAMLKLYRGWSDNLATLNDRELLRALQEGPNDATFRALLLEFVRRSK